MKRRKFFVTGAASVGVAASLAAPALAQTGSRPDVRWSLASGYPRTLNAIYGAMEMVTKRVSELTDGHFKKPACSC